jgi:glycine oxidase
MIHTIVIGAGVMGLSCAWRLARIGASVDLLDGRHCGEGATLAALGALWPPSPLVNGPLQQLHRASLWEFEGFVRELESASGRKIRFNRHGRVELLDSNKDTVRAVEEAGVACGDWPSFGGAAPVMEMLEPAEVAARFPQVAGDGRGALLCRATAQVRVADLVGALRGACENAGVRIHEARAVTGLQDDGRRVTGVQTDGGIMRADIVLAAAGAWSGALSNQVAAVAPLRPAKGQGLALAMPAGWDLEMIVKSGPIYLIPWREAGEVLVGSTTEPQAGFDEEPTVGGRTVLTRGAAELVPLLTDAPVLRHWAGLRPQHLARRHPPVMGVHPRIPNLYVCTGHYKTGIGMAGLVSRLIAGMMVEDALCPELAEFAPR